MIRILWTKVRWIHNSTLNIFFTWLSKIANLKFTIFCNNHLLIRIKMVWYDISDWTPNIESKLIMVIFVQLIQRYWVCARESNILQFTPSFLFSFFKIAFWTRLLKLFVHLIRCISSQNFNDAMLHIAKTAIFFQRQGDVRSCNLGGQSRDMSFVHKSWKTNSQKHNFQHSEDWIIQSDGVESSFHYNFFYGKSFAFVIKGCCFLPL